MSTGQTLIFDCPSCRDPFAETQQPDVDIHSGATYRCSSCGEQVIFVALTVDQYVVYANGAADCCCVARSCEYEPSTLVDTPEGGTRCD